MFRREVRTGAKALLLACATAFSLSGCGGGGGGPAAVVLAIQAVLVGTQPAGPLSPFGTTAGGDSVTLTGTGFVAASVVRFGANAGVVTSNGATRIVVTTPPGPQGFANVTVTNPGGETTTLVDVFQYVAPPFLASLVALTGPTTGQSVAPIAGAQTMELRGANFRAGVEVRVDGQLVAAVLLDPTRITFVAPTTDGDKTVTLTLRNTEGLSTTLPGGMIYTQEFSLDPSTTPFTQTKARHLFRRAAFGATPARVTQAVADGLLATTNGLVNFTNDAAVETTALAFYATPPPASGLNERTNKEWWIHQMLKNPNPLQDRLAWFLHDHFATSERGWNGDAIWFLHEQIKTLRAFSVGPADSLADGTPGLNYDWRKILIAMAKDRAMLEWLDGRQSTAAFPNENWARELWELFMLGEGVGYTEADIKEAAKAFTGFFWLRLPGQQHLEMRYRPSRHHTGDKTILGVTGKFGYDDISPLHETNAALATDPVDTAGGVVALTLAQRPVEASRFICRKLAEYFLYEGQDDSLVEALASDLRTPGTNHWNLKPILLKILRSKAMYSSRALKGKVRSPVEFVVGFLRTTDISLNVTAATNASQVRTRLTNIGQLPIEPPDVNGWPAGNAWLGSQMMVERYNFLNFAVMQLDAIATQIDPLVPPQGQRNATALVDHIAGILDVRLASNARRKAIDYASSYLTPANGTPVPYDENNTQHVKTKARGLLYMIAQYHDAQQD